MGGLCVFICGPHSTGKSTLLKDIRPHLPGFIVIEEVARNIMRNRGWTRDQIVPEKYPAAFFKLNQEILEAQIKAELEKNALQSDTIYDRGLDPLVYCGFYLGEEAYQRLLTTDGVDMWLQRMRNSLVLLMTPHAECIADDSVRLTSSLCELRRLCDRFDTELSRHNIPYVKISELDRRKRVDIVLETIKEMKNKH